MGHHHHAHHHHDHGHAGHIHDHHTARSGNKKGLLIALLITASIAVLEFFGGLFTGSLALLSDSGHMLSDASSLVLSLVAIWFAARPASKRNTYGYHRMEILAALLNGVTLFVIAGFIIWEAYGRLLDPPTVSSNTMIVIAVIGLLANLASAAALMKKGDVKGNVNLKSAYLHVLGDALGSVGAILAGIFMSLFGWYIFDPIISVVVALLILRGAWGVMAQSVHILMEGSPATIDQSQVKQCLEGIPGVVEVHDLHIWTITSGMDALSCHLMIEDGSQSQIVLQEAISALEKTFHIGHSTIQVETPHIQHRELMV
ncbi:MAG: cation diffusion facilitator family transporter [Paenibacillus sp.]|jgi:cobalt-zinc-cadmium efflux system protein|uniref:cation diffusion facilitator family transporter n=1 Tax=Paenibacillus sp. TaxID=58172 RepID=UPI0029123107|nr:cation diffusion facilitator family transporter [Paenibacillus sp.]MDU4695173.1 cation diffusion facilitator family transporter [Paenibacillus sp.]